MKNRRGVTNWGSTSVLNNINHVHTLDKAAFRVFCGVGGFGALLFPPGPVAVLELPWLPGLL